MQRISKDNKKPDAILTSDWHLREDTPICRTDNYWDAQWKKVDFIKNLQQKYKRPVLHAGDLFDHWKPSPFLLSETIKHIPDHFHTIYGQHDLPQHNLDLAYKSGIYTLAEAGKLEILSRCHWGQLPGTNKEGMDCSIFFEIYEGDYIEEIDSLSADVLVWHTMVYQGNLPWPGCTAPTAKRLLKKYPNYTLIVTGDNHKPFVEEYEGRLLVNPGSLMRMDADQVNHRPRVYLWCAKTNTVTPIFLPIEQNVISREHIERIEKRNERIEAFVSRLSDDWEGTVSFKENLKRFEESNNIVPSVMNIVHKSIETN